MDALVSPVHKICKVAEILYSSTSEVPSKIISVPPCLPKASKAYLFKLDLIRCVSKFDMFRWL